MKSKIQSVASGLVLALLVSGTVLWAFAGAALDNVRIVRTFAATTTGLFSSLNPSVSGNPVTFTVQVLGTINSPTGTMNFTRNGSPIAGCSAVALGRVERVAGIAPWIFGETRGEIPGGFRPTIGH